MKNRILFGFIFLATSFNVLCQSDILHLKLDLNFDWQKKQASGIASITLLLTQATDTIKLDAGNLSIHSVSMDGKPLKFIYDGGDAPQGLAIVMNEKKQINKAFVIEISYFTTYENRSDPNAIWGSFGKGLRFLEPTSTTPKKRKQIWSSGEPYYNKYWFPCKDDISDIHTTEIIATVDLPLMVIANGDLVNITENANSSRTYHYTTAQAFPSYLVAIVIGHYEDIELHHGRLLIHNYGYPDEIEAVKATTVLLPDMIKFVETHTGHSYPHNQYSQVVAQDYPFPGLVGQHMVSILSDNYIDDYGVHKDYQYLWDGVAMQALANQWFGNLLMPEKWDDIWLNNAFAQYFAGLYTAKVNSKDEYLIYIQPFEKGSVFLDWEAGNRHPVATNQFNDVSKFISDSYSKYKGALILHLLQKELGEELWWKSLKSYVATYAHKKVNTNDFLEVIEQTTGKSYKWFFDQWIYKVGLPHFKITHSFNDTDQRLDLFIDQIPSQRLDSIYENAIFFQGKMQVEINGQLHTVELKPQKKNTFSFDLNGPLNYINCNSEGTWLCTIEHSQTAEAYLHQLASSKDAVARQIAIDSLVAKALDTKNTAIQEQFSKALLNQLMTANYWRFKTNVLSALRKISQPPYDKPMIDVLLHLIKNDSSWVKTSAIFTLGNTADVQYDNLYIEALSDKSDRVINAAAIALGKTKSPEAFDLLIGLDNKPSWKSQSRISALNGLEQLGDERAIDFALKCLEDNNSPRWYLATAVWDYPFAAVNTLVSLGKSALAYPILFKQFKNAMHGSDINDIFQIVSLINLLKEEQAKEIYPMLKEKFKNDAVILPAIVAYESQFIDSIK